MNLYDDETQIDEYVEDYYTLVHVIRSVEDAMQGSFLESDSSESHHQVNHCCGNNYILNMNSEQIDEFRDSAKQIEEFKCTLLCPRGLVNLDSFYSAILYAIRYQFKSKKGECQNDNQLKHEK